MVVMELFIRKYTITYWGDKMSYLQLTLQWFREIYSIYIYKDKENVGKNLNRWGTKLKVIQNFIAFS